MPGVFAYYDIDDAAIIRDYFILMARCYAADTPIIIDAAMTLTLLLLILRHYYHYFAAIILRYYARLHAITLRCCR